MNCPNCNSKFGYVRLRKKSWICRSCGQESEFPTLKKIAKNFAGIKNQ